jgi:rhomboid protease GluP
MIYYLTGWIIYIFLLLICTPSQTSLRETKKVSLVDKLLLNKGSILLGSLMLFIAYLTFDGKDLNPSLGYILGMSRSGVFKHHKYYQLITHVFIHGGFIHLLVNMNSFVILSAYERRVGFWRYCEVFLVSSILGGAIELFILPKNIVTMGASGGLCGLFAALALDGVEMPFWKWALSTIGLGIGITMMSVYGAHQVQTPDQQVDNGAHFLGVLLGAIYTRLWPFSFSKKTAFIPISENTVYLTSSNETTEDKSI